MALSEDLRRRLLRFQKNEITEYHTYSRLARSVRSGENSAVLRKIADEELKHYNHWRTYTEVDVAPDRVRVRMYSVSGRLLGFTFGVKLMERGEQQAQAGYEELRGVVAGIDELVKSENDHEKAILDLLDEEALRYTGSVILGLNDALVELTGALAGLTLALRDTRLVALTGSITGIAAALSMAASEYLSTKSDDPKKDPVKASLYTGAAYLATVLVLVVPYLLLDNLYLCLGLALASSVIIIAAFNYYLSVAKEIPFAGRFLEMAGLSLGIAAFTFFIGFLFRHFFGIET